MKAFFIFLVFALMVVCAVLIMWARNKKFRKFVKEHIHYIFNGWFRQTGEGDE